MSSFYRGDLAVPAAGKVNGDDYQSDLVNKKYKAAKDADDGSHHGHPVGVVTYQDGEFHIRVTVQGKDWHFRALDLDTVQSCALRFFGAARGKINFRLDRAAWLAKDGERAAIARL
jgi:hypothetical protein